MNAKLLATNQLDRKTIDRLFSRAQHLLTSVNNRQVIGTLSDHIIANLFFEPSTRTLNAFEIAAKRLHAFVLNTRLDNSSLAKGETIIDMVRNLEAMGASMFIIRHSDQTMIESIARHLKHTTALINPGGGKEEHPTQALLDVFTMTRHKKDIKNLKIVLIGDTRYSRVASSFITLVTKLGCQNIALISPLELTSTQKNKNILAVTKIEDGLINADVVICLRLQKERMNEEALGTLENFSKDYCLTVKRLKLAKPDAIVMHPGPMNRNVEISDDVADGPQSVILEQVNNGVAIRMALMEHLLSAQLKQTRIETV